MDQLSAHLDRGWDLAQKGDAAGASVCARRALELDPQSPEVHNLLGFASALAGESEEAIEHYKQAIALDETYFEAMLNAAEVLMHPLGHWDDALSLISDALDYAETPEEVADCVLLRVDALLGKGDVEEAARALRMIPDNRFENPNYAFMIGRAYYEVGDIEKAAPLIEEAATADPNHADAQYYLGLVRDDRGDMQGATAAFLRARSLDVAQPGPPWAPSPEAFATLVQGVIGKLDALLARYLSEVELYVVDVPGAELVVDGVDPRALMIVDAAAPSEEAMPTRTRLFVYQRNVERAAGSLEAMEEELLHALEREITAMFLEKDGGPQTDKSQLN